MGIEHKKYGRDPLFDFACTRNCGARNSAAGAGLEFAGSISGFGKIRLLSVSKSQTDEVGMIR
jgi:hypothetical protein